MWLGDVNDAMHRKRARRIWGDLRKASWVFAAERQLVEIETWARPYEFVRYGRRTWGGGQMEKSA